MKEDDVISQLALIKEGEYVQMCNFQQALGYTEQEKYEFKEKFQFSPKGTFMYTTIYDN